MSNSFSSTEASDRSLAAGAITDVPGGHILRMGSDIVIAAALRSVRRQVHPAELTALLDSLRRHADGGCAAAALVRAWLVRRSRPGGRN